MNLKNLLSKGLDKVEKEVKENISEEKIKNIIEEVSKKIKVNLTEEKINKVASTIKSKLKDVDLDKITDLVEKEIKKIASK